MHELICDDNRYVTTVLDTHRLEHSSPWNTHPPGTLIPPEHTSPRISHPPGTPISLELPSPGAPIPHGTLIPPLII